MLKSEVRCVKNIYGNTNSINTNRINLYHKLKIKLYTVC